jgi:sortase A
MNSRRAPFSTLVSRLAFQVDRKILLLQEESYLRLDLSAHEAALIRPLPWGHEFFASAKRFTLAALVIYLALFTLTNAPAYSKILSANLSAALQAQEAAPAPAVLLTTDPWTGATLVEAPQETPLAISGLGTKPEQLLALNLTPTTYEDRLRVPSIQVNAPVVETEIGLNALVADDWNTLENQIQSTLLMGIAHYPGTAEPGKIGNAFFTGHSSNVFWQPSQYNTVFALLPQINVGDAIYITHNQKEFHYRVIEKKEVKPSDVSILEQGSAKHLTLMTCTPVGTTLKRLVVTAELVE